jgi:hypothetical protein
VFDGKVIKRTGYLRQQSVSQAEAKLKMMEEKED